jgi:uncharacterized protein YqeY
MAMKQRLADEMREAMKGREKLRLATLRLLLASVKNREVELRRDLDDEEFVEIANREAKRRREAIDAYEKAGREDRASTEREELAVIQTYLPAALSPEEIDVLVEEAVVATGASAPGDMGKVMGAVMANVKGRADGRDVQARVRARLGA